MKKDKEIKIPDAIVYNIYHKVEQDELYKREVSINGSVYTVTLSSDNPRENIDYLTEKGLFILKQLKQEGK
jgi:hypothetical protein